VLRKIALLYCAIEIIKMSFLLVEGVEIGVFNQIKPWLFWTVNILAILAVFSYGLNRKVLPKSIWLIILIFYLAMRAYEVYPFGLVPMETNLYLSVFIYLGYLYPVVPSILCLFYFCIDRDTYETL
jgi:hypothetical protein